MGLAEVYQAAKTARSTRLWPRLPRDLQTKVIRALFKLSMTRRLEETTLVGYRMCSPDGDMLKVLFHEIFVDAVYLFYSSTDEPKIVDCGSNIGMSILFFKMLYPKAYIVAFEPDPFTFQVLSKNISQNHLSNVELHQCALSGADEQISFYRPSSPSSSSLQMNVLRPRQENTACIVVPARRLSDFISSDEIDLLKLDIEGAETAVLRELADAGKLRKIKRIHFEYQHHTDPDCDNLSLVLQLLEFHGFGYQIRTSGGTSPSERVVQNLLFYCYRKDTPTPSHNGGLSCS
jgi:FkbM family methyltransferase